MPEEPPVQFVILQEIRTLHRQVVSLEGKLDKAADQIGSLGNEVAGLSARYNGCHESLRSLEVTVNGNPSNDKAPGLEKRVFTLETRYSLWTVLVRSLWAVLAAVLTAALISLLV